VDVLRDEGYNIGLIRPQTLWPFPDNAFERKEIKKYIVVEMSMGQMVPDVKVACNDKNKVVFYGRTGGVLIGVEEILKFSRSIMGGDI
jgi:2-oxoglutarate ferredoxin oxidoreductase subunit alpha